MSYILFFLQAEDCIRDIGVTGVQTCALPILRLDRGGLDAGTVAQDGPRRDHQTVRARDVAPPALLLHDLEHVFSFRSEERRVWNECRYLCLGDTLLNPHS